MGALLLSNGVSMGYIAQCLETDFGYLYMASVETCNKHCTKQTISYKRIRCIVGDTIHVEVGTMGSA